MTYCLEKHTAAEPGKSSQAVWTRYAVCGDRALLARIRMGQPHPEHWRVTAAHAGSGLDSMKKAG